MFLFCLDQIFQIHRLSNLFFVGEGGGHCKLDSVASCMCSLEGQRKGLHHLIHCYLLSLSLILLQIASLTTLCGLLKYVTLSHFRSKPCTYVILPCGQGIIHIQYWNIYKTYISKMYFILWVSNYPAAYNWVSCGSKSELHDQNCLSVI